MAAASITTDFVKQFNIVHSLPGRQKPDEYGQLLNTIYSNSSEDRLEQNLLAYVSSLLGAPISGVDDSKESISIIAARTLLSTFITRLNTLASTDTKTSVAEQTLQQYLSPRVLSFEEQDSSLKLLLADAYQQNEDYLDTAKTLKSINLDSPQRTVTDNEKAAIWVRIARCYLEEDDPTSASSWVNRAKNILHNISDTTIRLQFQMCQARILDSQRQFLDASAAFHRMSLEAVVDDEDRLQALSAAIVCAVLAPAGPQRARTLARLYKDDRASQTEEFSILEKIFLDRVLTPEEVTAFGAKLQPHQLAKTADGSTVLDRAVLEHNLLGASKLYHNIRITDLGTMLGVSSQRAEQYAAQMIEQKRLAGYIDQIDGMIFFDGHASDVSSSSGGGGGGGDAGTAGTRARSKDSHAGMDELRRWDANIQSVAEDVEKIVTMIQTQYPDFSTAGIV